MKIDIISKPPALPFGKGEDQFSILLERWTGEQRALILDACMDGGSIQALQFACQRIVGDWQNVCDENNNPIPILREDEKGKRSLFGEFMGAIPITLQLDVLTGIVAFVGIPREAIKLPQLIEVLEKAGKGGTPNPTGSSASAGPSTVSGG